MLLSTLSVYKEDFITWFTGWAYNPRLVNENSVMMISLGVNTWWQVSDQSDRILVLFLKVSSFVNNLWSSIADLWLVKYFPYFLSSHMSSPVLLSQISSKIIHHENYYGKVTFICKRNKMNNDWKGRNINLNIMRVMCDCVGRKIFKIYRFSISWNG